MEYRKVGKWGLVLSQLSLGSWLTFGKKLGLNDVRVLIRKAFEKGITFYETAEI